MQNLEIARYTYQRYEKILGKLYYLGCILISLPVLAMFCAFNLKIGSIYVVEYTLLYFIVSWSTLTSVYSSTVLALLHAIWKFHRFEFYRHWRRILLVYATTLLSTVAVLAYSVYNFYFLLCTADFVSETYTFAFWNPWTPYIGICYPVI